MNIQGLRYSYPKAKKETLKNVSFELKKNKLNVLVGLNGAGKTTLFDCMTKTLIANEGDLQLPSTLETLYLTQNIFYSSELTGRDMSLFIGSLAEMKEYKQMNSFIHTLHSEREKELLKHLWDMKLGKMSVGERKWLFVMLLTCIKKELYIFDEPTSGVDPSSRKNIMNRLDELVDKNATCLISTHQLHDLSHVAAHVIFLHDGVILYEGDYHEWLEKFQTRDPDEAFIKMIEYSDKVK